MVTTRDRFKEMKAREEKLKLGGGVEAIEKVHSEGKLTSRERIERLLDPGSFMEIDLWVRACKTGFDIDELQIPGDGVIAGYGEVKGRPIYIWANDNTVLDGTVAEVGIRKIITAMEKALRERVPVVGIYDSPGWRLQNLVHAHGFFTIGRMMYFQTISSGVIPQVSLIMGPCTGGLALSAPLADFTFMVKETSYMHIAPYSTDENGKNLGAPGIHWKKSGNCDLLTNNDADCMDKCKRLLSFLPSHNKEKLPLVDNSDPPDRADEDLLDIVPANPSKYFDMRNVIRRVSDMGDYFEVKGSYARNITTGFVRFNGEPAGIIGTNSIWMAGCEDTSSSDKHARFTRFCDAFNIPLIYFADCPGFLPSAAQERMGILRHGCMVIHSTSEATVPKISIYVRKCFGGAQLAMPCNFVKADRYLAWPIVQRGVMGAEGLAAIIFMNDIKKAKTPEEAQQIREKGIETMRERVEIFSIANNEGIIDPRQTRQAIIQALKCTKNKEQEMPWRKHENINL